MTPRAPTKGETMDKRQAMREARRRWGKRAEIREYATPRKITGDTRAVGLNVGGFFMVQGRGTSWAEAFEYADRQKARDIAEYCGGAR